MSSKDDARERFEELCDNHVADENGYLDLPLWELAGVILSQLLKNKNKASDKIGTIETTVSAVASLMDDASCANKGKKRKLSQEEEEQSDPSSTVVAATAKNRKRCTVETCHNFAKKGGVCITHGATQQRKRCTFEGCFKQEQRGGLCIRHGAQVSFCSEEEMTAVAAVVATRRVRTYKTCSWEDCAKLAQKGGLCYSHGAKARKCSSEGCTNNAKRRGLCKRHGAYAPSKRKKKMGYYILFVRCVTVSSIKLVGLYFT